MSLSSQ